MKINRTEHTSITGEIKTIRDIKDTLEEQRSQVYEIDAEIAELERLKRELSNLIGRNDSVLTDNYEMI